MVASQCGIPLFAPFEGNASASVSSFFPNNICLGDILKTPAIRTTLCRVPTCALPAKTCSEITALTHLYGAEELKKAVADPAYRNDWGFYDDTVLDEAWKKFEELFALGPAFFHCLP